MAKKEMEETPEIEPSLWDKIGPWAFILGLIIAVLSAFMGTVNWLLGVLGLLVGLLNITRKETQAFLLASLTFLVSVNALSVTLTKLVGLVPVINRLLNVVDPMLANITLFVAPGAAIVALRALYGLSRD